MCGDMAPLTHRSAAMRALATETRDCGAGLASAVGTTGKSSADAKYSQSLSDCSLDFTLAAPSTITMPAVVLSKRILVPLSTLPTHHARPRYLAAIFPRALGVLIEIQLTSPDLALFGDIVDYGNVIASSLTWKARG